MNISKVVRDRVITFLNQGIKKDFYEVPSMTEKKMENIIVNRPFVSWSDIVGLSLFYDRKIHHPFFHLCLIIHFSVFADF